MVVGEEGDVNCYHAGGCAALSADCMAIWLENEGEEHHDDQA